MNKSRVFFKVLFFLTVVFLSHSCTSNDDLSDKIGAKRFINNFDYDAYHYKLYPRVTDGIDVTLEFDSINKHEGERSLRCDFTFSGNKSEDANEIFELVKIWNNNYRTDLSFHPLGVSLWLNSSGSSNKFTLKLLQQDDEFSLQGHQHYEFVYSDDAILEKTGWQQIVVPYEWFTPSDKNVDVEMNLSRINGYQFDIENVSGEPQSGTIYFDSFEQLTSYEPEVKGVPRFTSIFISAGRGDNRNRDWEAEFNSYLELGIDTVIIQYAAARSPKSDSLPTLFYESDEITWKKGERPAIERILPAAEKTGMKVIMGLHGGRYPKDKGDVAAYDDLFEKNRDMLDDLYDKFSSYNSLVGWYIPEEFHDGANNGWWKYEDRMLLANYQQRVAAHAKSKPKQLIVCIAPALWRGRPADMTYEFFKSFFEKTPDIDILYLQDCGGRCSVNQSDFMVTLPHWYSHIKRACDETGIQFGVDIEAFKRCPAENIDNHPKSWDDLEVQLRMASIFTSNITMYSWMDFRPGVGAFDEYKDYLKENGLLKSQQ